MLGRKWLPVVGMFEALGLAAFFGTFNIANGWVYSSLGHTARQLRQQIVTTPITVLGFFIGLPWGALGVATSFSATRALLALPQLYYCYQGTPVNLRDTLTTLARPAFASISAGVSVWALHLLFRTGWPLSQVVVDGVAFGIVYLLLWLVMPGGRTYLRQFGSVLSELRSRRGPDARPQESAA